MVNRYDLLLALCAKIRPETIMEIGVFDGRNAAKLIKVSGAEKYIGFDLFEDLTDELYKKEFSKKPPRQKEVYLHFYNTVPICVINLIKGNTKETLRYHTGESPDFVWVDGGHSVETIKSDWENLKKIINERTVVVFDDYYNHGLDTTKFGCNCLLGEFLQDGYKIQKIGCDEFKNQMGLESYSISMIVITKGNL